jgi:outer membrane protein assembly factor BamE (lipoprotein component of BamABCDE complex)
MHSCRRALAPLALIAVLAGCVNPPSSPAPANAGSGPAAAAAGDHPERTLKKGMTADQVRQIMGAPAEIKPKPAPTGKAEVWVYRRTVLGPPQQVQVGVQPITVTVQDPDGVTRQKTLREDPIYRQAHDKITETILLLMFDNQLVEQGVTSQKQQEFE